MSGNKKKQPAKSVAKAANEALAAAAAPGPIPGCVWSNNNRACNKTWWWLVFLKQIDTALAASAEIKMNELVFWNDEASAQERELEAAGLADMLIKGFTEVNGATYEPAYNYASAMLAMTRVLTDAAKTVCEFAAVNDELFRFFNEA